MRRYLACVTLGALLLGAGLYAEATPTDPCEKSYAAPMNSTAKLKAYEDCRFDRIDASQKRIEARLDSPTPEPSPTPVPTSPAPTEQPTTASPTNTPAPEQPTTAAPLADYPDASTTGVPAGTQLKKVPADATSGPGWTWHGGTEECIHVDTDGAVLSALDVAGCIEVYAANVTIQNTRVTAPGEGWAIGIRGVSGATVKDSTLSGNGQEMFVGVKDVTGSSEITMLRNDVADWGNGAVIASRGLVQDNYFHDPKFKSGDHTNGAMDNGGRTDGTLTVRHNTILNSFDQTDAIAFFQDFGVIKNVTVDDNLLAGGSYSLYAGAGSKGASSNVVVTNNHFSTRYFANGGTFGPVCCFDSSGTGNKWAGNVWDDGPKAGQVIPAPTP